MVTTTLPDDNLHSEAAANPSVEPVKQMVEDWSSFFQSLQQRGNPSNSMGSINITVATFSLIYYYPSTTEQHQLHY